MGTQNSSRKRTKGAAAVAAKAPAGALAAKVVKAGPVTNGGRKATAPVVAKEAPVRGGNAPAKDAGSKDPGSKDSSSRDSSSRDSSSRDSRKTAAVPAMQPERSPPALPIPIASFTF